MLTLGIAPSEGVLFSELVLRGTLGAFFALSGYHKLFNPRSRERLKSTFMEDGCYSPTMMYLIPAAEGLGGLGLLAGALVPAACAGLIIILLGAIKLDCVARVKKRGPEDWTYVVSMSLYLQEVLYVVMLAILAVIYDGRWAIDSLIQKVFNG